MTRLSGYVCKIHYNQLQMTPGTYNVRVAAPIKMLEALQEVFGLNFFNIICIVYIIYYFYKKKKKYVYIFRCRKI